MLNFLGNLTPIPDVAVLRSSYDSAFAANIAPTDSWLYDYFNTSFEVTFGEVDIPPFGTVSAAVWSLSMWTSFQLFKDEDGYSCPNPCPFSSGPFTLPP